MKIEMGESLIYSWLRHEKGCQLVQTNWKSSVYWDFFHSDELNNLYSRFRNYYKDKYQFDISKGGSLEQFLKQAEIDVIGIAFSAEQEHFYAVDVAFHESGLNYGDKEKTLNKIIQKCVRSALCLYGYFGASTAEIVFASPKITPAIQNDLTPLFTELTNLFHQCGLCFSAYLYCNEIFEEKIMQQILQKSKNISDSNELFLRSVQMCQIFSCAENREPSHVPVVHSHIARTTQIQTGKANRKIPKWAVSPTQNNYKIIRAYLQLFEKHGRVTRPALEHRCQSPAEYPDTYVSDFNGNFASMKTDKSNSHGKVFTDDGYNISIWEEVEDSIEKYRDLFLQ